MTEPHELDAVAQAELVRSGEVSPLELVDAAIARIEALDDGPQGLNAVIHRRFDAARSEAAGPLPDGPFRGVPITLKDLWPASAGDPLHLGMRGLKEAGYCHPTDSNLVRQYRAAGFVIVGRTNTPELGLSATTEPLAYGHTRNPWNRSHSPGGSSGGAAASVAAGMTAIANASDGGGSIRIPAAHTNLVGLKPSRGRVSMGPLQDEWSNSVQHVVCHTMRDAAAALDATAGPFPGDGVVAPPPPAPFLSFLDQAPKPLRIGVTTRSREDVETHPELIAAVHHVATVLESLGHNVVLDASPAPLHRAEPAFGLLSQVGTNAQLAAIGDMIGRELAETDVEPATWFVARLADKITGTQVIQAQKTLTNYRHEMAAWWSGDPDDDSEPGYDLLLTPTTAQPPPPLGQLTPTDEEPWRGLFGSIPYAVFTSPFNITGQPSLSVPAGFTSGGLPMGAQLVAAYGREDLIIGVGGQLETALRWKERRATDSPGGRS